MDLYAFDWLTAIWNIVMTALLVFICVFIYKLYKHISRNQ